MSSGPNFSGEAVAQQVAKSREDYLSQLFTLLRQPSISAQNTGTVECANLLRQTMEDLGIATRVIETAGQPVVYGERMRNPNAPTLLVYGHYDVQPPDPIEAWHSPPFEPTIRDGRIYARGAGDNKGQLMAQLLGVQTYLTLYGDLPINIKFMFEGEEESGSVHLASFVEDHRDLLRCDLVYTSDGPMHESGAPVVLLGVRGMLYVELSRRCAKWDNHSGNKGNVVQNPAWRFVELLSAMRDPRGRVLIPGFYDGVLPPSDHELAHLRSLPFDPAQAAKQAGCASLNMDGETYYRKLMFEPTFNICGFHSGYGGAGSKTIIPAEATVKLDMRLVYGQDPDDIFEKLCAYVQQFDPEVTVTHLGQMRPSRTSADLPVIQDVIAAVTAAYRLQPVVMPSLGGSLPDYVWTGILGVPSVIVPYANSDEANHSPNENIGVENFFAGIRCICHVIAKLGGA
ncbi:MAG: M20/M25/M40 family metallo-hydrolase [Alicyclobacillus sp.]|nr:M20/M25/M40 family metallo-hydrolase [Alicyclobacillus sp.]